MQEMTQFEEVKQKQLLTNKPLFIAGPCSAETEEQVLQTAAALAQTKKVDIFRAGIWKPRTRPGHFEGVGEIGLTWLQNVQKTYHIPCAIEVANAKQVELALKYNIDLLWIGARSTVNPFSVQEIADALKGTQTPILIKNPINPDIDLWTGALERILESGSREVGLIHRGFSSYGNARYRNVPMWQLAIEMKRRFTDIPMIIDPSHITGNSKLIPEILQKAIDLNYDGAMIETHPDPSEAWSDSKQQVTPQQYLNIINEIVWRASDIEENKIIQRLEDLRHTIDQYDDQIIALLQKRMQVSEQIGIVKKAHNVTILQTKRWNEIYKRLKKLAATLNLSDEFMNHYMEALHLESIRHQDIVMNKKD